MLLLKPIKIYGTWDEGIVIDYHMLKSKFLGYDENGKEQDKLDVKLIINLKSARDMYSKDFFRCCNELSLSPQARAKLSISAPPPKKKTLMDILSEEDNDDE